MLHYVPNTIAIESECHSDRNRRPDLGNKTEDSDISQSNYSTWFLTKIHIGQKTQHLQINRDRRQGGDKGRNRDRS